LGNLVRNRQGDGAAAGAEIGNAQSGGMTMSGCAVEPVDRDARNRAAIFNPEVDPVWARVDQLLGPESSADIQASLKTAARSPSTLQ